MKYEKIFMANGGSEELKERIYGSLLVAKHFNAHLSILHAVLGVNLDRQIPSHIITELEDYSKQTQKKQRDDLNNILQESSKQIGVQILEKDLSKYSLERESSVHLYIKEGDRSSIIAQESKYSDLVIAAAPPEGISTASFEAAILKSGKPVIVIPRVMKTFNTQSVIIAWNNSQEAARAVTSSLDLLKKAKRVHIVSSKEYLPKGDDLEKIKAYLSFHCIETTSELLKTTLHPGEALLKTAVENKFDLIVIGAFGHDGLKELMFGGATKYLLKHSTLPMFMTH